MHRLSHLDKVFVCHEIILSSQADRNHVARISIVHLFAPLESWLDPLVKLFARALGAIAFHIIDFTFQNHGEQIIIGSREVNGVGETRGECSPIHLTESLPVVDCGNHHTAHLFIDLSTCCGFTYLSALIHDSQQHTGEFRWCFLDFLNDDDAGHFDKVVNIILNASFGCRGCIDDVHSIGADCIFESQCNLSLTTAWWSLENRVNSLCESRLLCQLKSLSNTSNVCVQTKEMVKVAHVIVWQMERSVSNNLRLSVPTFCFL